MIDEEFVNLIDNAKTIITKNNFEEFMPIALHIERFVHERDIPFSYFYDDEQYYNIVCFPDKNFLRVTQDIRIELTDKLKEIKEGNYFTENVINGYITQLKFNNSPVLTAINIFYPIFNNLRFILETVPGNSRFIRMKKRTNNKQHIALFNEIGLLTDKIKYVHPKYTLEELLYSLYDPAQDDDFSDNLEMFNIVLDKWKKVGYNNGTVAPKNNTFEGKKLLDELEIKYLATNNDYNSFGCLVNLKNYKLFEKNMPSKFSLNHYRVSSIHDPRIKATEVLELGRPIIKFWIILDHELIPIDKDGNIHPIVTLRLILLEHNIYSTLNKLPVANFKLSMFNYVLNQYKKGDEFSFDKSTITNYVGKQMDIQSFIQNERLVGKMEFIARKNIS